MSLHTDSRRDESSGNIPNDYFAPAKWQGHQPTVRQASQFRWDIAIPLALVLAIGLVLLDKNGIKLLVPGDRASAMASAAMVAEEDAQEVTDDVTATEPSESGHMASASQRDTDLDVELTVSERLPYVGDTVVCEARVSGDTSGCRFEWDTNFTHTANGSQLILGPFTESDMGASCLVKVEVRNANGGYAHTELIGSIAVQPAFSFELSHSSVALDYMNSTCEIYIERSLYRGDSARPDQVSWYNDDTGEPLGSGESLSLSLGLGDPIRSFRIRCVASCGKFSDTEYASVN